MTEVRQVTVAHLKSGMRCYELTSSFRFIYQANLVRT